jgi:hypothetical protein
VANKGDSTVGVRIIMLCQYSARMDNIVREVRA